MGMGYAANYCDVVRPEFVEKMAPKEWSKLNKLIGGMWDSFALEIQMEECEEDEYEAYQELLKAFEKNTGLQLELLYHDTDDYGDRYDDVSGHFWGVDGVYQYSPAGEKYKGEIERKHYVTFG